MMVANYSDIIVMRHFLEGAALYASELTQTPVVNAGDGDASAPLSNFARFIYHASNAR